MAEQILKYNSLVYQFYFIYDNLKSSKLHLATVKWTIDVSKY
jgi:hypothetical protein